MRAKEVARTTGLSVNTVNEHLKSARRKLGTSDSWSAAQLLRALENPTKSSDTNKSGSPRPSIVTQNHSTDTSAFEPVVVERSSVLPFAKKGRPWNDLSFGWRLAWPFRSEEHTSELQSLMRISYAVFCLKQKKYKHRKSDKTVTNY